MELIGWSNGDFGGSTKTYMGGLITGSVSWAISGEKGYIARVGNLTFKNRFESMDCAKRKIDILVQNRCLDYIS